MRSNSTCVASAVFVCLVAGAFTGCGRSAPTNLSPTPKDDPARYERAVRDTEEKVRRDQEAEREALRGMNKALPQ
jgi:hypothetical protein